MTKEKFNECLDRFRGGDNGGIEEIYNEYYKKIYVTAYFVVRDEHMAEDVASTVFADIIKQAKGNSIYIEYPNTWVYRVTQNTAYKEIKAAHPENAELNEQITGDKGELKDSEFLMDFYKALDAFSPRQKEYAIQHYIHDMQYKDIAKLHNVTENAVKSSFIYIKKHLKKYFGKENYTHLLSLFL